MHDIGALPGGASSLPTWISDRGLIAGFSENGETDPLYPGLPQFRAVLWEHGNVKSLGTLGSGYQSEANAVNDRGQVVGASTTAIPDSNSMYSGDLNFYQVPSSPYGYQLRAFLWDRENGMQDLGTLGGADARALLINERGQVVGHSYTGSTQSPFCNYPLATGSFIWEKDKGMLDLGSLGGTCTIALNLNQRGQIVGASNLTGDQLQHAFLWEKGKLRDLGGSLGGSFTGAFSLSETGEAAGYAYFAGDVVFHATLWRRVGKLTDLGVLGSDECSYATGINAREQVVGGSVSNCSAAEPNFRAFIWEKDTMFDLNALIPAGSALYLQMVVTINESGEIAGNGVDVEGNSHAFVLIPCDQGHPGVEGCDYSMAEPATAAAIPAPRVTRGLRQAGSGVQTFHGLPARFPGPWTRAPKAPTASDPTASEDDLGRDRIDLPTDADNVSYPQCPMYKCSSIRQPTSTCELGGSLMCLFIPQPGIKRRAYDPKYKRACWFCQPI